MKVCNIRTEYLHNPLGLGVLSPRLTWTLEEVTTQTAFEVIYTINGEKKTSGVINSSSMNYTFKEQFKSRDYVEFQIRVFENEKESDLSSKHFFEIGLLESSDWKAKWITGNYKVNKKNRYPVDYFKKEFDTCNISKARLYISACGLYEASINGVKVGSAVLAPGVTDYNKRIQYQTYDVTNMILSGKNDLQLLLADGWYRGSIGAKGFLNVYGTVTKIIAQLEITHNDGSVSLVTTDDKCMWSNDGSYLFADLKDGEIVDNRKEPTFTKCAKQLNFNANLWGSNNLLVEEHEVSKPISIFTSPSGKTILKFPYNVAGYISFDINASEGDTLDIVMGEMLVDKEVSLKNVQCIRKGKKTPLQEVHFICKEGKNSYHTKFFYGGFQYLSIDSTCKINKDDFKQIAIYSSIEETGSFKCSNELVNIFFENTMRSLKSNSVDIPTDCPTRERMGWTGDSQLFFESASFLTDYSAFTRKHIVDVYDRQDKNGRLPQIAPYMAEDWFMDVMNGSVGWADVGILTPYRFYKKYGDKRLLEEYYDRMVLYANFMMRRCGPARGIYALYATPLHLSRKNRRFAVNNGQSYGEWAEPTDVKAFQWYDFAQPHPEESTAYTVWMMKLMIEISEILGKTEHVPTFKKYYEGCKKAYQELVTKPKFSLDTDRQAKLVRPIYLDLLTEEQKVFAEERLVKAMENYKWRLGTGFLSTPFILDVLADIDSKYAYKLLENEEMPGWLYMAKNNTGTIWEGWEGLNSQAGIASLNHYSKGAMVEWLFHGMCGINIVSKNSFEITPVIGGSIKNANAIYKSIYGVVESGWKVENNKVVFNVSIPANTVATFKFNNIVKELKSGTYTFEV